MQYVHGHSARVVAAHARRTATEAAAFVLPRLRSGDRLVDVGCGPGTITTGLARRVSVAVGVDAAPVVLAYAREHARRGDVANVRFLAASAYRLPLADGSMDVAYAHQLLQHLEDPVAALREMHRVLRPGGLVAVRDADYGTMVHAPRHEGIDAWLRLYRETARAGGGEPDAGRRLSGWVREAGFVRPAVTASSWVYADREACAEWAELWIDRLGPDRPLLAAAARHGIAGAGGVDRMIAAWRDWAGAPSAFFAFLHGEVVAEKPA